MAADKRRVIYKYIIEDKRFVLPFNQPASELTVGLVNLKIHQEQLLTDLFARLFPGEPLDLRPVTLDAARDVMRVEGEALVYADNLWFDREFMDDFITQARKTGRACRAAVCEDDFAVSTYTLPLSTSFSERAPCPDGFFDSPYFKAAAARMNGDDNERAYINKIKNGSRHVRMVDLWYFPKGYTPDIAPIVVLTEARTIGFYNVPNFMSMGDTDRLTHYAPARAIIAIESWVHVYFASIIFGNFARASRLDKIMNISVFAQLRLLWHAVLQQKQVLSIDHPSVVKIGRGTVIHPTAIITGPAEIGENCSIEAGAVIDNCTIGDNVTIDTGCILKMSTVARGCFLPFRASLYLTQVMEDTIIAQNTCLQMCVVGRNSFVGAGSTFTDFNLIGKKPIRASDVNGQPREVGQIVLGGAVGHNCRIGAGMIVFPGRMIESDVVLFASPQRRVIRDAVEFEESDHLYVKGGAEIHKRFYPRKNEIEEEVHTETW